MQLFNISSFFCQHYIFFKEGLSLQAPPAVYTPPWSQPLSSIFPSNTSVSQPFNQAPATSPAPAWGNIPGSFGNSTASQQLPHGAPPQSPMDPGPLIQPWGTPSRPAYFHLALCPTGQQSSSPPPLVPPRAVATKEAPKVDSNAFVDLDPLGEKEKRDIKDMFKDFQMAKPPNVPARKGE